MHKIALIGLLILFSNFCCVAMDSDTRVNSSRCDRHELQIIQSGVSCCILAAVCLAGTSYQSTPLKEKNATRSYCDATKKYCIDDPSWLDRCCVSFGCIRGDDQTE